jgi:CheY-like chemotaxis protein
MPLKEDLKSADYAPRIVLHIDDDQDDRDLVNKAIHSIDPAMVIREATDGRKALDFLHQAKLFGDLPCLIILDLNMPVMDCYETYKEIIKDATLSIIPIVVFTTSFNENDVQQWRRENIVMLTKPSTYAEFTDSVRKMLGYFSPTNKEKSS